MINKNAKITISRALATCLSFGTFFLGGYFVRCVLEKSLNTLNKNEIMVWSIILPLIAVIILLYADLQRRSIEKALRNTNQRYKDLIDNIQGGVIICAFDEKLQGSKASYISSGWTKLTGYTLNELNYALNGNPQALILPEDRELSNKEYKNQTTAGKSYELEYRIKRKDGKIVWVIDRGILTIDDKGMAQNLSIITEVTEIKEKEAELWRMSRTDPLTGLKNKSAAITTCQNILEKQNTRLHALMVLDIDDFKSINDHLGHIFGDTVLIEVSARLKGLFRSADIIGRIGGDEFIVLMTDISSKSIAQTKAEEICSVFCNAYLGETEKYKISCSVGVAYSVESDNYQEMFRKADIALYSAKSKGKNQAVTYCDDDTIKSTSPRKETDLVDVQEKDSGQLKLKERVFELLYSSVDFVGSIKMALALLGRILNVDRVYIFENSTDNRFSSNTYEWCSEGIISQGKNRQALPIGEIGMLDCFDENGVFACHDVTELPENIRHFAQLQKAQSFTQIAIVENGTICGFIGFDNMNKCSIPTKENMEIMTFAAKVIGVFILKKRAEDGVALYNQNKVEALDALPNRIYVIDKNFRVRYMNNLTKATATHAREGEYCYETFMMNSSPCDDCPALKCGTHPASSEIYNEKFGLNLISNASRVTWEGDDSMVLLCCQDVKRRE